MELRQLEYFTAVADTGSFTAAAQRTHTTQPNISAQIRALERELGAALFDRAGRRVRLTDAGAAALPAARASLRSADAMAQSVADVNDLLRGSLAVGMVDGCTMQPLFAALGRLHRDHPAIEISLSEQGSEDLISAVGNGDLDIALAGHDGDLPPSLESLTVFSERVVAAAPPNHPALEHTASGDELSLDDLRSHHLICLPRGAGIRTTFDRGARTFRPAMEASSPDAILELVAGGLGVGILSESIVSGRRDITGRTIREITEPAVLGFVWRSEASAVTRAFIALIRDAFGIRR
ncbi:LysR family transcriptional regulator [Gordonia sp. ABSL49_1]|uniref:LysR family transcriptional regulator n=1 Tax=Gordonia sp. B7-2 TaxID=3420932 RepID=UPI001F0F37CE|nr:LysR family transcriptional regulator [Gordonia sp. ABSL49_1]